MTTLNNTKNIPLSERPKLYKQMLEQPYDLSKLETKNLFNYLQAESKYAKLTFKYYSEFLNIMNSLIFFYILCYNTTTKHSMNLAIFIGVDSVSMLTAFIYYFLIKNKQSQQNTKVILIFSFFGIFLSKIINILSHTPSHNLLHIHKYIKFNFVLFSTAFLFCFDYYPNPNYPSSTVTKMLYSIIAFVMSNLVGAIETKIRIFIYAINFFEFIPEIRKLSGSNRQNVFGYLLCFIWIEMYLMYMEKYKYCLRLLVGNAAVIVVYPVLFDWYYKRRKKLIKGLWDLPDVTFYY